MLKNILKKSFIDISASFMIILICFIFISFYPHFMNYTPAQRLLFYDLLVRVVLGLSIIATLGIIAHHFIMQTELFSTKKSIRRGVSVFILALLTLIVNLCVFSVIPKTYVLIGIVFIVLICVGGSIVGFVIEDRIEKRNIKIINQRLNELKDEQQKDNINEKV